MHTLAVVGVLMSTQIFAADTIYDFGLKTIDGAEMPLDHYKGKVVLLVNTASQ
jgi:glutathione peroxidase